MKRVTLLCGFLLASGALTALANDWPGFLGPDGDGRSSETSLLLEWPDQGPPVRWHMPAGEGYSAPAVARGRLFLFDRHEDRARLTCLDAKSGEELWRSEYGTDYEDLYGFSNGPRASPVVDGDRVYSFGAGGRLRCHRVVDGSLVWDVNTAAQFGVVQNFFGVGATPVVEGDLLIVPVGGSPPGSPDVRSGNVEGAGSGIVAFDKRTGRVRYSVTDELASYATPVLRTIGERRWGFVFARGGLIGFEPTTGAVDFRFPWRARKLESVNAASPVVVADMVFITESYGPGAALLKIRPGGHDVLRKDENRDGVLRSHWATPVYHEGVLYGCSGAGSGDAELRAVHLRSGKLGWSKPGLGRTTLIYADGHLIVLGEYGDLLVVRATPEEYQEVSRFTPKSSSKKKQPLLKHPAWSPPVLSDALLFVRGKDRLLCIDLAN